MVKRKDGGAVGQALRSSCILSQRLYMYLLLSLFLGCVMQGSDYQNFCRIYDSIDCCKSSSVLDVCRSMLGTGHKPHVGVDVSRKGM